MLCLSPNIVTKHGVKVDPAGYHVVDERVVAANENLAVRLLQHSSYGVVARAKVLLENCWGKSRIQRPLSNGWVGCQQD